MSRPYLHLFIGTLGASVEASKPLHNRFSEGGESSAKAIASQMGNLSHSVFVEARPLGNGRIMLLDYWRDAQMMAAFFADPRVIAAGEALCPQYQETTWEVAEDAYQFQFPLPQGPTVDALATVQAPVKSWAETAEQFSSLALGNAALGRSRGQVGHAVFKRLGAGDHDEVLAIDQWASLEGLSQHYGDAQAWQGFGTTLSDPRQEGVWLRAEGFAEW